MSVWMFFVCFFARDGDADHDDEGAEHVRGGVDSVRDHRAGIGEDTCQQLKGGQNQIDNDADDRNAHGKVGFVDNGLGWVLVFHGKLPPV